MQQPQHRNHARRCASHWKSGLAFAGALREQWGMTCTMKVKDGAIRKAGFKALLE